MGEVNVSVVIGDIVAANLPEVRELVSDEGKRMPTKDAADLLRRLLSEAATMGHQQKMIDTTQQEEGEN